MSQSRVHLAAAHIGTYVECEEPSKSYRNQWRTNMGFGAPLVLAAMLLARLRLCRGFRRHRNLDHVAVAIREGIALVANAAVCP